MNYFGARYYDSDLGRWTSVDPLAHLRHGITQYHYCQNNPINRFDPDGKFDWRSNDEIFASKRSQSGLSSYESGDEKPQKKSNSANVSSRNILNISMTGVSTYSGLKEKILMENGVELLGNLENAKLAGYTFRFIGTIGGMVTFTFDGMNLVEALNNDKISNFDRTCLAIDLGIDAISLYPAFWWLPVAKYGLELAVPVFMPSLKPSWTPNIYRENNFFNTDATSVRITK